MVARRMVRGRYETAASEVIAVDILGLFIWFAALAKV
jgi:hypothetical protein